MVFGKYSSNLWSVFHDFYMKWLFFTYFFKKSHCFFILIICKLKFHVLNYPVIGITNISDMYYHLLLCNQLKSSSIGFPSYERNFKKLLFMASKWNIKCHFLNILNQAPSFSLSWFFQARMTQKALSYIFLSSKQTFLYICILWFLFKKTMIAPLVSFYYISMWWCWYTWQLCTRFITCITGVNVFWLLSYIILF